MPRYLPVQADAANENIQRVYDQMESELGFVPNFIKTVATSGNFLDGVSGLYLCMAGETALAGKIRQLAILKTCKVNRCKHTVTRHTELARRAGWTDEQIEAMDDYAASDLFTYYEKEVLRLAELVSEEPDDIQDDYWTQLDNHFTSDQVVELVTMIAFYNMLNRVVLALDIEADPVPPEA